MTEAELAELIRDCPTLFHMAERGSWPSIQKHGLLSTSALLDLYDVRGPRREAIEGRRRPEGVTVEHPALRPAVIRDQKPMDDAGLRLCLLDGLTPEGWYRCLNRKVYFWLTRERLLRLLNARPYRELEHDVLELDTALLVAAYRLAIRLSPINSGTTKPFPSTAAKRGRDTFLPIADYPYARWRAQGRKAGERVVELTVDYAVPDVARFVRWVVAMRGGGRGGHRGVRRRPISLALRRKRLTLHARCRTTQGGETMSGPYSGACFCGAVALRVSGQPNAMGYCHCGSCRSWSAGPVNAFSLWPLDAVEVTKGAENIATFHKTDMSHRQFCRLCGGHLMTVHPPLQMIDVYAATIPDLAFAPQVHVNYAETVLPMRDGLPKLKDFPAEFGGSGEMVPE